MLKYIDKPHKIKAYYYDETICPKPLPPLKTRVYIHGKSGFWAYVRDLSQAEIVANTTVDIKINLEITVNYNPEILKLYSDLWIEFNKTTYKLQSKPDEYNYNKGDMKLRVEERKDSDRKVNNEQFRGAL